MLGIFKTPSYSGNESYRYVERLVKNGRKVLIVSPYMDEYYANFLVGLSRSKKIYVISSSLSKGTKKILVRGRFPKAILSFDLLLAFSYYLLYPAIPGVAIYLLPLVALLTILFLFFALKRKPVNVNIKLPKRFVHAKMYITEDGAIQGSANLTFRSMHKNIEHINMVSDKEEIKHLEKDFWRIWKEI